jgi:hypothetical protein
MKNMDALAFAVEGGRTKIADYLRSYQQFREIGLSTIHDRPLWVQAV